MSTISKHFIIITLSSANKKTQRPQLPLTCTHTPVFKLIWFLHFLQPTDSSHLMHCILGFVVCFPSQHLHLSLIKRVFSLKTSLNSVQLHRKHSCCFLQLVFCLVFHTCMYFWYLTSATFWAICWIYFKLSEISMEAESSSIEVCPFRVCLEVHVHFQSLTKPKPKTKYISLPFTP